MSLLALPSTLGRTSSSSTSAPNGGEYKNMITSVSQPMDWCKITRGVVAISH
jgi:hypothetical protein